ncbi:S-adenosyl-L-methionine-dependent methyltransferase [Fusarium redolens]|uniref:S-adenosyl-L-methionine-dependent methyltransferase n=1 Tax=Fusarium redolens TaxID=48865 RepID=A0A9P9HK34_FUSRE|nr:S-adenosyl-L-methionine-dependent methyltransferase [Fusarium redolens]KAH7259025.1 S-adenosyl-L-methionine-dependent methyltransferase [Fusarium redolens]
MSSPKSPAKSPKSPQSPPGAVEAAEAPAAQARDGFIQPDTDSDSAYSLSTDVTDTESLRSSILNYKWVHGRRFHAYGDGTYWGANDDRQQEAEDLIHELFRVVLDGKLYEAPIGKNPQNVLDVGCGTGIWAIDMADLHPSAEVIGVDLSPIQPNFIPPNCRFEVDDINKEWTFPENKFDFIHIRYMTGTVPDWTELLKKAQRHLKPGGWIEHVELWGDARADDDTMSPESPLKTWVKIFEQVGEKIGNPFFWNPADEFEKAGLKNITEKKVKVPIGTWAKDKDLKQWGAWNRQFLLQGLEGFSIRSLTELLGWEYEKAQVFLVEMRKELLNPKLHSYVLVTTVYGQKPEE